MRFGPRGAGSRVAVGLVTGLALVLVVAGCSGTDHAADTATSDARTSFTVLTDQGKQAFESNDDGAAFSFETDDGSGSLRFDPEGDGAESSGDSGSFALSPGPPEGWPDDFPTPDGAEIIEGNVIDADTVTQLTAIYRVPLAPSEALDFFESALAGPATWKEIRNPDEAAYDASLSFDGDFSGYLIVTTTPDGTQVAVQLMVEG
jgi:hypothetical protein